MKKVLGIMMAVAMVAGLAAAEAVYSQNVVGYVRTELPEGYVIGGMQFIGEESKVADIFGDSLPAGSRVLLWNIDTASYQTANYDEVFVPVQGLVTQWSPNLEVATGQGFWVQTPEEVEAILSGEVPMEEDAEITIVEGYQMLVYPYPVEVLVSELGLVPEQGDRIMIWNKETGSYQTSNYDEVFVPIQGLVTQWSPDLTIGIGQGFWYQTSEETTWVPEIPYTLD